MSKLKVDNFIGFCMLILSHNRRSDISMRKDITIEKLTFGGEEVNKSALARQYGVVGKQSIEDLTPYHLY